MSTRGAIGRKSGNGFKGVYQHNDSYPSGLGKTLWDMNKDRFGGNTEKMLKYLIDEHPAGWSSAGDECYCHGGGRLGTRHEKGWVVTDKNASGSGVEYAYVFSGNVMEIWSTYTKINGKTEKMIGFFGAGDSKASWKVIGKVNLKGAEPNWDSFQ